MLESYYGESFTFKAYKVEDRDSFGTSMRLEEE